ncbi:TetR/AcrR family transcriptional regulator [Trueperella bialowiezensis]|uniref:Putative DNA-binding transcriptional regulator n=1 Tax=Trueperella bialowiezensis TaxID=312285 RepID=A0A3S4X4X5_9ACTO|nr:TetR family transcriptional regulator [Trueperella bialowiezensis]VEI12782.1 putative DNA-binding transcriptional regulator [Trueperella bialowiezensis]
MTRTTETRGPAGRRGEVRNRLIEAGRELFTKKEFSAVTLREIAAKADCDAGLINYYFGGKAGLFREAMSLPHDPIEVIHEAFGDGRPGVGKRVCLAVLKLWEESTVPSYAKIYISTLLSSESTFEMFSSWVVNEMLEPMAAKLPVSNAKLRAELAFGQVIGLCSARYVFAREPLASLPREQVANIYGPLVDAVLFGKLPQTNVSP